MEAGGWLEKHSIQSSPLNTGQLDAIDITWLAKGALLPFSERQYDRCKQRAPCAHLVTGQLPGIFQTEDVYSTSFISRYFRLTRMHRYWIRKIAAHYHSFLMAIGLSLEGRSSGFSKSLIFSTRVHIM